jgi:hypothetical protein
MRVELRYLLSLLRRLTLRPSGHIREKPKTYLEMSNESKMPIDSASAVDFTRLTMSSLV